MLSWNIWNDKTNLDTRLRSICTLIEDKCPDFICLQEVSSSVLGKLLCLDWVKNYFVSSDYIEPNANGVASGEVIFSKYPFTKNESFPYTNSSAHKRINICDVNLPINKVFPDTDSGHTVCGANITLLTTQLEPLKLFSSIRKDQFYGTINFLLEQENVFILADTNFTDEEDDVLDLVDPWKDAHVENFDAQGKTMETCPNDWFTVNSEVNSFVNGFQQYRFDRVIYKSSHWTLCDFEMVGTKPVASSANSANSSNNSKPIFPSSHFGIWCEFKKKAT